MAETPRFYPSDPQPGTCSVCFSVVDEMFVPQHERWHRTTDQTSRTGVSRRIGLAQPHGTEVFVTFGLATDDNPAMVMPWLESITRPDDLREAVVVVDIWNGTDAMVVGRLSGRTQ